ncbi:MAG: hypothetical protein L6R38_003165 [Xanthoria sp. 2 TBL-2021]|nr:MAG: hypothetical protein L6R38_003165 [Xanthoria sp. 2 TBL-2021]
MSSTQSTPNMSSTQTTSQIGPESSKGPQEMHTEPETSPKVLKRKGKSRDLNFEQAWGELLDEKVSQELHKLVVDVRKEYTEGEQLPSLDAIAYTHFAKSWSEMRKALRAKEKTKIKRDLASRGSVGSVEFEALDILRLRPCSAPRWKLHEQSVWASARAWEAMKLRM